MTLKSTRIWSFFDVWTFYVTPNCISLSNSRLILTFRYMTYQFKRNPNTIPVSKIICTCTTIFLKFYNKCVKKTNLATIHRHVNIFIITSYFTLQQVKVSIEIVSGSQLTRKDENVINIFFFFNLILDVGQF
jgi:hypothetical protein